MSKKETKKSAKTVGPKWTRAGTHSTYELASEERDMLMNDETLQVKVRRRHATDNYTVHFRKNPELTLEKKAKKKEKPQKKKRSKKQA